MTAQLGIVPQGLWLKTHFYREGTLLHAVTYSCIAGHPEIFRVSVNLKPIIDRVVKFHNQMHDQKISGEVVVSCIGWDDSPSIEGIFDTIGDIAQSAANLVKKVGKAKVVSQIASSIKSAVKSKVTGAVLLGAAVAFPPIGAPAAAAYAAANGALTAIDQAKSAVSAARTIVNKSTSPAVKAQLKGQLTSWAGATVKNAMAKGVKLPSGLGTIAQAVKLTKDNAAKAKSVLAGIAAKAKAGDINAQKLARIVTLAHSARGKLKTIHRATPKAMPRLKGKPASNLNGFAAVLIDRRGHIVPGRYQENKQGTRGVVLRGGKVYRGVFSSVSGEREMVLGNFHAGSIGSSNPFRDCPPNLR